MIGGLPAQQCLGALSDGACAGFVQSVRQRTVLGRTWAQTAAVASTNFMALSRLVATAENPCCSSRGSAGIHVIPRRIERKSLLRNGNSEFPSPCLN